MLRSPCHLFLRQTKTQSFQPQTSRPKQTSLAFLLPSVPTWLIQDKWGIKASKMRQY